MSEPPPADLPTEPAPLATAVSVPPPPPALSPAPPPAPQWVPPAVPVQSLEYTLPARGSRPGILTAVGVLSIVIASFSGLYGVFSGLQGLAYYMMSVAAGQAAKAAAAAASAASASPPGTMAPGPIQPGPMQPGPPPVAVGPGSVGMTPAERIAAIQSLTKDEPLSPRRRQQLDAILAAVGRRLGTDSIADRGTMPVSRSGEAGPEYFVTSRGRLEIFDDRAVFFPNDGSPTVRLSAPAQAATAPADDVEPAATTPAVGPGGLTQAEIQAVIQQVDALAKQATGSAPTAQQVATIQSLLSMPGQQLVPPGTWGGVGYSDVDPSGQLTVTFNSGSMLVLGAQGNVISQTTPAMLAGAAMGAFSMNPLALALYIVATVVSLGLAVLLLVAGIMVLRQSPAGRRLHLVYAWLKLPAAVAGGAAMAFMLHEMFSGFASAGGAAAMPPGFSWRVMTWAAVPAGLACLYPIALLITMNTRLVREYYQSVSAGT